MKRKSKEEAAKWAKEFRWRQEERAKARDPFNFPTDKPIIISFSGGRTSGYLLYRAVKRNFGKLPDNVIVAFRNTGMEFERTLEFVEECSQRWSVKIVWLEYKYLRGQPTHKKHSFVEVDFRTASRNGEPFEQVIQARSDVRDSKDELPFVPNQGMRYCTGELKQRTLLRYLRSLNIYEFYNCIGVRADEPKRWMNIVDCPSGRLTGESPLAPLFDCRITEADVLNFWKCQPFDLGLLPEESNCTLCFLKSHAKLQRIASKQPELVDWWAKQEEKTQSEFRRGKPYRELLSLPMVCDVGDNIDEEPCHCTD